MTNLPVENACPNCELLRAELAAVRCELVALQAQVEKLMAQLAAAQKNSANSSRPPSSDIVKPPRSGSTTPGKRKRGGQPGHPRHTRPPFEPEEIDHRLDYRIAVCPDCGGKTTPLASAPRILQQVEVIETPIVISEHRAHTCFCKHCQKSFAAEIPREVKQSGLFGPRLTAVVAYLKGGCHCSFSTIRRLLRDVVGVTVSRAHLRGVCATVSDSLDGAYQQLLAALPLQSQLNVDETGHKEYAQRHWTWCFRAATFSLFKIDPTRSAQVLIDVLGEEFAGVLGCDYFSAYRKYMNDCHVLVQFCLAHLLRDMRFLEEHPEPRNQAYGRRLIAAMRKMFHVIHQRDQYAPQDFQIALQDAGDELAAEAEYRVPDTREAQNLANRFREHGESYLRFITTPGVEPTNNLAEQAIRFVVIDRLVTQGSRSEGGRRWLERIWTTMATCAQQGRSAFEFLVDSVQSHCQGQTTPTLLIDNSA
jgi:transposase